MSVFRGNVVGLKFNSLSVPSSGGGTPLQRRNSNNVTKKVGTLFADLLEEETDEVGGGLFLEIALWHEDSDDVVDDATTSISRGINNTITTMANFGDSCCHYCGEVGKFPIIQNT